jgi:two-component system phosphate regulon sensor histidine kinase PhoR
MWHSWTFWRLFGTYGVLVLASIALLGLMIDAQVERRELHQLEEGLRDKAVFVEEAVRGRNADQLAALQGRWIILRQETRTRVTLIAGDGRVLADSDESPTQMENHADRPEVVQAREHGTGTATRYSNTVHQSMMYAARRTEDASPLVAFVRVARPLDSIEEQMHGLRRIVWTVAGLAALAGLGAALWLARQLTRPLRELTAGAERVAAGNFGQKVYAVSRDEVGTLARSFNAMSERLAGLFAQIEEDRQQLRAVLGGMVEGVIAVDAGQKVLFANERAGRLLDFPIDSAVGRKLWEVVRHRAIHQVVRQVIGGTDPYQEELDWAGPQVRTLAVHAARMPHAAGAGAVLVLHDTTELRRLERLRQEFVANVSHELKTPLSVIKVCAETLLGGALDDAENRGHFLQQIDEQASRLHALIIDMLSLARIESGQAAFDFEAVPVASAVAACLERHRARAESKNQILEAAPADTPAPSVNGELAAWADEEAVGEILDNLVDNALKYTPVGGRITVRWHGDDGVVCLEVEDTGIGIPETDLPRVFERFYRVDKARSRELGGTGLGLSIVKHLVQALGGSISAASRVGSGTTFSVRLPRSGRTP